MIRSRVPKHTTEAVASVAPDARIEVASPAWFEYTPRGIKPTRIPTWEEYQDTAIPLSYFNDSINFLIGDFCRIGEQTFGERYTQALTLFGDKAYQTVANAKSVCTRVPFDVRREAPATFSHHAIVSHLSPNQQRIWLDRVCAEHLTTDELRQLLHPEKPEITLSRRLKAAINAVRRVMDIAPEIWHQSLQDIISELRSVEDQ